MRGGTRPSILALAVATTVVMAACGVPGGSGGGSGPSDSSVQPEASTDPAAPSAALAKDALAETVVDGLSLRAGPTTSAARLGLLPANEPAFVVAGPVQADGYAWYQVAAVRQPYLGDCEGPAPEPSLECAQWFGWAAAVTPEGETWIRALDFECPTGRDTATFLQLLPASRLACAGDDEWALTAWIAPDTVGRGCEPVWQTSPFWLDGACTLVFPQPDPNQADTDTRIQVHVHPDLGSCALGTGGPCPFDALRGTWIEVVGHHDDPAATNCVAELAPAYEEAPVAAPDADRVVHECRTRFVVTAVREGAAPPF